MFSEFERPANCRGPVGPSRARTSGLFSALFRLGGSRMRQYLLQVSVYDPLRRRDHQFVRFEARSDLAALHHAQRRAKQLNAIEWKLSGSDHQPIGGGRVSRRAG